MFNPRKNSFALSFARNLLLPLALAAAFTSPASATSTTPSVVPFLCESSSDGSVVEFVNSGNRAVLLVSLDGVSDYGGAILANIPTVNANTATVVVDAIPTTNTANLALELVVRTTYSGGTKTFSVAPTAAVNKGTYTICEFEFSKYGLPASAQITNLAVLVKVDSSSSDGGAVYLYGYELNGTAITKRVLTSAGCVSF
jgi:hypothetical protein